MKPDEVKYERVYKILKNKIESGLIPVGSRLPGRAVLCREFGTSERTIRKAVEMLARDGLLETAPRKKPTVAGGYDPHRDAERTMQKADAVAANDILKTGILLCYPINGRGMALCRGDDWRIPEAVIKHMDPDRPAEFWRLSNRFWRFFISRNENELILRTVDSLGFGEIDPLPGTLEDRRTYLEGLKELIRTVKSGGRPESVAFASLYPLYSDVICRAAADSPFRLGAGKLDQRLNKAQERYSGIYLDLIGLIATGRYQPGDRIPTHKELQKFYHVSVDTTIKAVQILQEWGVVTAVRGKGIFVAMGLKELQGLRIGPEVFACPLRRFLDSMELLTLTIEGTAAHAASFAAREEAAGLAEKMRAQREEVYDHQLIPRTLLDFITDHIQYDALRSIYKYLCGNYSVGRGIPKLVSREKTPGNLNIYMQCIEAAEILEDGEISRFAGHTADVYRSVQRLVIELCGKLGYLEAAMRVYDGETLWK